MPFLREIIKKLRKILFLGQVVCFTPVLKYCEFTIIFTGKEMKRISRKETWKLPCQKNPQNLFWELPEAPMAKRRHSYLPLPPKTILLRYVKKILVSTLAHGTCVLRRGTLNGSFFSLFLFSSSFSFFSFLLFFFYSFISLILSGSWIPGIPVFSCPIFLSYFFSIPLLFFPHIS